MPISAAIGIATAIGSAVADVGAGIAAGIGAIGADVIGGAAAADIAGGAVAADVAGGAVAADVAGGAVAADVAGGAAAADIAGATALPEILVTPAAVGGAEAAGAGALTGAEAAGGAAALAGGVTAIPETFGAGGAGGAISPTEALGGVGAPTAALSPADVVGSDFGALTAAGIGPSVDISGAGTGLGAATDTALSFAPSAPIDPLSGVGGGGGGLATDAFAGAPGAVEGQVPADVATALNTGQIGGLTSPTDIFSQATEPGTVGQLTGGTGIPTPQAMEVPGAPIQNIPGSVGETALASTATPGATDINAISASTGALPPGGSLTAPGGLTRAGTSLFSGSTLRTAAMLAPLGALGLTLARGQPSLPPAEQQALANVSPGSPISNVANQNLTEASTGILQPGQVAQINQYTTNAKNQLYQLYARMGRDPTGDTDYIQGLAQIDQNAQIMGQKFIDAAVTNGLNAQGVIDQTLQSAAQMQVQSDQAFQASLNSSLQSLGLVAALNFAGSKGA